MLASDWYTELSRIATAAGEAAELPEGDATGGFDGDGWVWIWSDYLEGTQRVARIMYRVLPDAFNNGFQNEVLAAANLQEPRLSWGARIWAEYLDRQEIEESGGEILDSFGERLQTQLSKAREQAVRAAMNLESEHEQREEVISQVRDRFLS